MHRHSREYRHERRAEHREWEAARRGAFKHGFGPFGPGFGGRGGRGGGMFGIGKMLADGDLRVVVLALLEDGPRHGYDLIKAVEERSHGFYSPSPGVVYPTLTYLEEVGYASAASEGNKKIYTITEAGRQHLAENRELADSVLAGIDKFGRKLGQMRDWWENRDGGRQRDRDIPGVIDEVNEARRDLKAAIAEALEDAGEAIQRQVAKALRSAAEAVRKAGKADDDVIDL